MAVAQRKEFVTLSGIKVEVERRGKGKPLLLLHGEEALEPEAAFVDDLAKRFEVIIPSPPGYGASERPLWLTDPHDLAFVMHDLVDALKLTDAVVLGFSVGGWIAAEMATIDDGFIAKLVLVDPVGIKLGGPTDRDIADIWLLHPDKVADAQVARPGQGQARLRGDARRQADDHRAQYRDHGSLLLGAVHAQSQAQASPAPHQGADAAGLGRAGRHREGRQLRQGLSPELIPGAKLSVIANAGHLPHIEQPEAFMKVLGGFIG